MQRAARSARFLRTYVVPFAALIMLSCATFGATRIRCNATRCAGVRYARRYARRCGRIVGPRGTQSHGGCYACQRGEVLDRRDSLGQECLAVSFRCQSGIGMAGKVHRQFQRHPAAEKARNEAVPEGMEAPFPTVGVAEREACRLHVGTDNGCQAIDSWHRGENGGVGSRGTRGITPASEQSGRGYLKRLRVLTLVLRALARDLDRWWIRVKAYAVPCGLV
jgi:hypothetical protein